MNDIENVSKKSESGLMIIGIFWLVLGFFQILPFNIYIVKFFVGREFYIDNGLFINTFFINLILILLSLNLVTIIGGVNISKGIQLLKKKKILNINGKELTDFSKMGTEDILMYVVNFVIICFASVNNFSYSVANFLLLILIFVIDLFVYRNPIRKYNKEMLPNLDKRDDYFLSYVSTKSRLVCSILAWIGGPLFLHNFYAGKIMQGAIKIIVFIMGVFYFFNGEGTEMFGSLMLQGISVLYLLEAIQCLCGIYEDKNQKPITIWFHK